MSLFWYQRTIAIKPPTKEGEEEKSPIIRTYDQCFNTQKVIQALYDENGQFTVVLDDGHEETHPIEIKKHNGKTEVVRERSWYMSMIRLSEADAERFRANTDDEFLRNAKPGTVFTSSDHISEENKEESTVYAG